jgi:hypothetical protein
MHVRQINKKNHWGKSLVFSDFEIYTYVGVQNCNKNKHWKDRKKKWRKANCYIFWEGTDL